ncbi:MAG: methyltransferase domain-containing protein [bacterium]|nr:methyltransferase domain-containing protein [bacterium]
MVMVFGPALLFTHGPKSFLHRFPSAGKILNLGSGPRVISSKITNVDIAQYPGVSVISDIVSMPFGNNTVSRIICDNVLEHVSEPWKAVSEMHRIMEPGGLAYVSTPFLYPFHSSPNDFSRWTDEGLKSLFSEFEIVEVGVRSGPFSALNVYLCYLFATLFSFGSKRFYWILVDASIFIFFPIKFLDLVFNYFPRSINMASHLYCIVRK